MTSRISALLDDLYAIDPALKEHEEQLLPLIETLLQAKPDATPDPAFVEQLRGLLRERYAEPPRQTLRERIGAFFTVPSLGFGLGGAVAGILLAVAILPMLQPGSIPSGIPTEDAGAPLFTYSVTPIERQAFGDLGNANIQLNGSIPAGLGMGRGGGGGGGAEDVALEAMPLIAPDRTMPAFFPEYRYVFESTLPALPLGTVDVLKRTKGTLRADASSILPRLNIGLIDFSTFGDSSVESINFIQDKPFGFTYNIAFREGVISLYQNWERWPHPENDCREEACFRQFRTSPDDLPADDVLIGIAQAFVRDHKIDLSAYGAPAVDRSWLSQYDRMSASDRAQFSMGDVVRVVYPFMIEGKPVVDTSGNPSGISVGVSVRERKVQEAWGIMDRSYQSSAYAAADEEAIRRYLNTSGAYPDNVYPEGAERTRVDITLGAPTSGYATVTVFEENRADDLLVPALIFPVTNVPEEANFFNTSVIVPLAKDLLTQGDAGGGVMPRGR